MSYFYNRLKIMVMIAVAITAIQASAYDFKVGDLYYNINEDGITVAVTNGTDNNYSYSITGDIVIPSSVTNDGTTYYKVTTIGASAFYYCRNMTSVTIPNTVTKIDYHAFRSCTSLTSVSIPNSVTEIGDNAFGFCQGLTSVIIPNSVTTIGKYPFEGCKELTSIQVAQGNAFYDSRNNCNAIIETATNTLIQGCNNTIIPNSVTTIGDFAFSGHTGLTSVVIPSSVTVIGEAPFWDCAGLTSIQVEQGNATFDSRNNCNAIIETATNTLVVGCQNTIFPSTITTIGIYAFVGCTGLTSVTIPSSVTEICSWAFGMCSNLERVTIPSKLFKIGYFAFGSCYGLKEFISLRPIPPMLESGAFDGVTLNGVKLKVPSVGVDDYKTMDTWKEFNIVAIGDADGNDVVNGSDVTTLYNYLLNSEQSAGDTDIDGNGVTNGSDVTALYNILLNDNSSSDFDEAANIIGKYITQEGTYCKIGTQKINLVGYTANIYYVEPGVFYIDEMLAGLWSQRAGYGSHFGMQAYIELTPDNHFQVRDAIVPGWGDSYSEISDVIYNPETKEITYSLVYNSVYNFTVILKKSE